MYDDALSIRRTGNGYKVTVRDPELVKKNRADKGPYMDPNLEFVFKTEKEVTDFVVKALKQLKPEHTFDTAFKKALTEGMTDGE